MSGADLIRRDDRRHGAAHSRLMVSVGSACRPAAEHSVCCDVVKIATGDDCSECLSPARVRSGQSVVGRDGKATHDKVLYDQFASHRDDIERELGVSLVWDRLDDKGYSQAILTREGDYRDEAQHDEIAKWLVDWAAAFFRVMPKFDDAPR